MLEQLIGLSMDASADFRAFPDGKNAALFAELDRGFGVRAVLRPELALGRRRLRQALAVHPDRARWRRRFNLDPGTFERRTEVARQLIRQHADPATVVVQLHTLCGNGGERPYVLHTDTSYRLTERHYPEGAPLRGRRRERFLALEGEVYRSAHALYPRSAWLARSLVDDYGCSPDRVVVVGGGANVPLVQLAERRWDQRRALFVGMDWERKGGPVLLEAWRRVRSALPDAELQVVGVPRTPRHLPEGVEWLGLVRDRTRLRALFDEASVFVMPSIYEPWGHVFLEAMASGLPCIGTRGCAMPEIVEHGTTGTLVPRRDAVALADALVGLLGDPARAEAQGRAGQGRVRGGATWAAVVERMRPTLEAVAQG